MKFFNSHLSVEKIADAIENRLPENERQTIQSHLKNCPHCANEYKILARSINLMKIDESGDAPPVALDFAKNLFRARKQLAAPETSVTQKILATLKLDVSPFSPAFGERSAAAEAVRQMLFEAGDFDLDLRVRAGASGFNLAGQVLGELAEQNLIGLENAEFKAATSIGESGEFKIQNVPPGSYELILRMGATEIIIQDLALR